MHIRLTTLDDLPALLALYAHAREYMAANGNAEQWYGGYPQEVLLREDVAAGRGYLCEEDGRLLAAFVLAFGEDPSYERIEGAWLNSNPYATLHRVASSGEKPGTTDAIVAWSLGRCRNLRGDTHRKNLPMQRAFERNGFLPCGTVYMVSDGTPRIAYQRPADESVLPKMVVVEGTNASGKSSLGVQLAKRFNGEIISADSRQVFCRLNLGSGKITPEETEGVPHHLLDVCDPGDFFSMADFQKLAYEAAEDILSRGRIPFLVGGTGLYVDSVAEGYQLSTRMPDLAYRAELERLSTEELYTMLKKLLPDTDVDARNRNRVMRYLEKLHDGDSELPSKSPRYEVLRLGVTWERSVLRDRIDERLERRLAQGMVDEVRALLDDGVSAEFLKKLGLEYKFLTQYLIGELPDFDEMKALLATAIKQFAKRQMVWFRREPSIHWLDMTADPAAEAGALIEPFLYRVEEKQP